MPGPVTAPNLPPDTRTASGARAGPNAARTVRGELIVRTHVVPDVPEQSPPHRTNRPVSVGFAVRTTGVPWGTSAAQIGPHWILGPFTDPNAPSRTRTFRRSVDGGGGAPVVGGRVGALVEGGAFDVAGVVGGADVGGVEAGTEADAD